MDLTYTIPSLGITNILFNYETSLEAPYFLFALTDPCGVGPEYTIITPTGCDGNWILPIWGTQEIYEDLPDGIIYFSEPGSWTANVYYQESSSNEDPDNATFITGIIFQVLE